MSTIIFKAMMNKDSYLKGATAVKDLQDQKASQKGFLNKNNNSLALKMEALTPSPSGKEQTLPHKTYLISRERCTQKVVLLIMVPTHPDSFDRRSVIRKTWGTDPSTKTRWRTVFLLGQVANNSVQNEYAEAEGMMHGDLIRGAQTEDWDNLTLKTQMGLEWASKYCEFQYLLKADDDVFVNPYLLMDYLRKPDTPKTKFYTGRCKYNAPAVRKGKYKVSWDEYNKTTYPGYCLGAYVLSSDLVHRLVDLFDPSTKPFRFEDVYIGMLVEKMGDVEISPHSAFRHPRSCKHLPYTFAQHLFTADCMGQHFKLALKNRVEWELTQLRMEKNETRGNNT